MLKLFLIFAILLNLHFFASAQSVLIIGDSHTATDFGKILFKKVQSFHHHDLIIMGHASAAPKDWLGPKLKSFENVIYHNAHIAGLDYPIDEKLMQTGWHSVPLIQNILKDTRYRQLWKSAPHTKPDLVVIELGANDQKVISDDKGRVSTWNLKQEYLKRSQYIKEMISHVEDSGAQCLWVGPPMGRNKSWKKQRTLYRMLKKSIGHRCRFFNSNSYKATKCSDGIHFNCPQDRPEAARWAQNVAKVIQEML